MNTKDKFWETKEGIENYAQKISAVDLTQGYDPSVAKDDPELPTSPEGQLSKLAYASMRAVKFEKNTDPEKRKVEKIFIVAVQNYKNCRGTNFLAGQVAGDMIEDYLKQGAKDATEAGAGTFAVMRRFARLQSKSIDEVVKGTQHMTNEYFAKLENK
jgi:hypothetical protein